MMAGWLRMHKNSTAIIIGSFILIPLAFLAAVGAVVTGHIARSQIKRTGREGGGMALTGIIIGYAVAALCILLFLLAIGLGVFLGMTGRL